MKTDHLERRLAILESRRPAMPSISLDGLDDELKRRGLPTSIFESVDGTQPTYDVDLWPIERRRELSAGLAEHGLPFGWLNAH